MRDGFSVLWLSQIARVPESHDCLPQVRWRTLTLQSKDGSTLCRLWIWQRRLSLEPVSKGCGASILLEEEPRLAHDSHTLTILMGVSLCFGEPFFLACFRGTPKGHLFFFFRGGGLEAQCLGQCPGSKPGVGFTAYDIYIYIYICPPKPARAACVRQVRSF